MRNHLLVIVFLFSIPVCLNAWEISKSLSLGYFNEDNITFEVMERWHEKDWGIETGLNLAAGKEVARGKRLNVALDLRNRNYKNFSHYDQTFAGLKLSYRQKEGLGMMAPWWRIQAGIGQSQFYNDRLHDRTLSDLQFEYGKRVNSRTSLSGSFSLDQSRGSRTDVLDLQGRSLGFRGRYSLDSRWSFAWGFQNRRGDVAIHAWDGYYDFPTEVYMDDWGTWHGKEKTMYKAPNARTNSWSWGFILAPNRKTSWTLSFDKIETDKKGWLYTDKIVKILCNLDF